MGYQEAAQALAATVQTVTPGTTPAWLTWVLGGLSLVAIAADAWTMNKLAKKDDQPSVHQQMADFYYAKAAQMGQPAQPVVNVHVHSDAPASNYLMKESGKDTNIECFSCSSAHLASIKAGLDKMRENYQKEGGCGDQCQAWGATALREGMALLAHDLTDDKISAMPADQQKVARKYQAQVNDLMQQISGGNDQVLMLNQAAGVIGESIRFANEGDSVNHPQVQDRLADAEVLLAGAERFDIAAFDPDVAQKLRTARQGSGNAGDLKEIYKESQKVADQFTRPVIGRLGFKDIDALAQQGDTIYQGYKKDRRQYETRQEKAEHILTGLESHAGQPKQQKVYESRAEKADHIREGLIKAAARKAG